MGCGTSSTSLAEEETVPAMSGPWWEVSADARSPLGTAWATLPSSTIMEITMKKSTIKLDIINIQTIDVDDFGFRTAYLMFMKEKCRINRTTVSAAFSKGIFW